MPNAITFGDVRRCAQIGDIVVTETIHQPNLRLRAHDHRNANLNVVLGGAFTETVERQRFDCTRASVLFKPEGARHANDYSRAGAHCVAIEVPDHLRILFPRSSAHITVPQAVILTSTMLMEMDRPAGAARDLIIEGLVYEILGSTLRDTDRADWHDDLLDRIEELLDSRFSLHDLAAAVGRSPAHVARTFRRLHGVTIGAYVRRRRIAASMQQLSETDLPIAAIATSAGFADQSHFTNVFRRISGTTPRAYRDSHQNPSTTARPHKT